MVRKKLRHDTVSEPAAWQEIRDLCALMAHDVRQSILVELAAGPLDVGTLAARTGQSLPWISGSLKRLMKHDLVCFDQSARNRFYRLGKHAKVQRKKEKTIFDLSTKGGGGLTIVVTQKHVSKPTGTPPSSRVRARRRGVARA